MTYATVREQLRRTSALHHRLYHRYATMAALADGARARLLRELARQEAVLGRGLEKYANTREPALDTWIQYTAPDATLDELPDPNGGLGEVLRVAERWDHAIDAVYGPLRTLGARRLQELVQHFDSVRAYRVRARARLVTLDDDPVAEARDAASDAPLSAASTAHLHTIPGTERVVGTLARDEADADIVDEIRPAERFKQRQVEPIGVGYHHAG